MRLLLDTHVLIWALTTPERLPPQARASIETSRNVVLFSTVSGRSRSGSGEQAGLSMGPCHHPRRGRSIGFREEAITSAAAITAANLPPHHRDPFDRLLVGQAINGPARLVTADRLLGSYSELVDVV